MAIRTDLALDSSGDLPIEAVGLMPVAPSDNQHIKDAFASFRGDWKQYLQNGIGVRRKLKSTGLRMLDLERESRIQLTRDGYKVGNLKVRESANQTIVITPNVSR